jgi:DNA-binding response OmpR family regulator
VRELLRKVLGDHGHPVLEARHGRDALLVAERYERPIDLLIADVVMPRRSGREVAEAVEQLRPGLPVLFMSGYTDDAVVAAGVVEATTAFLQKPFAPEELARRVRATLDDARQGRTAGR